ncbi:YkgJ family cysteine cluster protein [Candidatus Bathyarchaeota archaeon]|nr:YkgJ family cysteine cluster protein [Candidatus Bathyarchaeota archaeon]
MKFDYPENVHFKCLRCALCCGDTEKRERKIFFTKIEANHIKQRTSMQSEEFAEEIKGCEPYVYKMKKTKKGKCIFLKNNSCSIYRIRPLICRFYPFELRETKSNRHVFAYTNECPGIGEGPLLTKRFFETLFKRLIKTLNKNSHTM